MAASDAEGDAGKARLALEQLCQMYWPPVLQFIRARGYSEADAQDLTQDFFVRFSQAAFLRNVCARYGRFRALIFSALKHLLCDHADRRAALKRGGGQQMLSLEDWMAAPDDGSHPCDPSVAEAGRLFDYEWATAVVRKALARLRDDFVARGRTRQFAVLQPFLVAGEKGTACADAALALAVPVGTVKAMVHHLRGSYGSLLRDEVAQTVADPRDLEDELRHLREILAFRQEPASARAN